MRINNFQLETQQSKVGKEAESVQHRDVVKVMRDSWTRELKESYLYNVGYAKYLEHKTSDLTKYMKQKRKALFG